MMRRFLLTAGILLGFACGPVDAQQIFSTQPQTSIGGSSGPLTVTQVLTLLNAMTLTGVQSLIGSTSSSGHTTTPTVMTFPAVVLAGTPVAQVVTGIVDPVSGGAPGVGALCQPGTSTATPIPLAITIRCTVTASGTLSLTGYSTTNIALSATTVSVNFFWTW